MLRARIRWGVRVRIGGRVTARDQGEVRVRGRVRVRVRVRVRPVACDGDCSAAMSVAPAGRHCLDITGQFASPPLGDLSGAGEGARGGVRGQHE